MMNRNSLAQKFQNNINKCDICYSQYNKYEKQPVIICPMHHTICRQCLNGLQSTGICPYCRQKINFGKIVVNNYIFQLLPNSPPPPNFRAPMNPQPYQPLPPLRPPQTTYSNQVDPSINYSSQRPIYPSNNVQINEVEQQNEGYHQNQNNRFEPIRQQVGLDNEANKTLYCVILISQLPFLIFNLYFSLSGTDPLCYDTPYANKAYVLRPWLLGIGISQCVILFILFLGLLLRQLDAINADSQRCFEFVSIGLLIIKIFVWLIMEPPLFTEVIERHCSGGVYAYGMFLTILHGILTILICMLSAFK